MSFARTSLCAASLPLSAVATRQANAQAADGTLATSADVSGFFRLDAAVGAGVAILILALLVVATYQKRRARRRDRRQALSGLRNGPRFRLIDIVCQAAWHQHKLDETRLQRALDIARNATDVDYDLAQLRDLAQLTDRVILPFHFRWMRADLTVDEKLVLFNAATSVMLASGKLSIADQRFLGVLSRNLGLKRSDLRELARLVQN